jgi:3-oxoacyl-[acyl-carrier-protein] synthase-3
MHDDLEIYVAGTASWIPESLPLATAIESGWVPETHQNLGYESIAIAGDIAAPDMAIRAARSAVRRSGIPDEEFGLVLHASCWFQGLEFWPTACYVANESVGQRAYALDVQQQCVGGLACVRLATAYLRSGFASTALLTTADNFSSPAIDRWNTLANIIFGDVGTALVLSTKTGFARLLSTVDNAENSLEGFSRGTTSLGLIPGQEQPVRLIERGVQQASRADAAGAWQRYESALLRTKDEALAAAKLEHKDVTWAVVPFVHRGGGQSENYDVLGFTEEQSLWNFGRHVGHLGAGDHVAGLNVLLENRALSSGDIVMLIGAGMGFSFSAAILEILEPPSW